MQDRAKKMVLNFVPSDKGKEIPKFTSFERQNAQDTCFQL
jgi:hypothetical protein